MAFDAGSIVARIKATAEGIKAGIDQAKSELNGFESKAKSVSKNLKTAGTSMTKYVTAPAIGLATAAVYTLSKFDDSMSRVQAISGATSEELGKLRDMAKDLGSTTAHSASAAADAMGYLALAGWNTNQILAATPDMLSLASAGSMDLATSADIVSDTMSAFQMEAERAGEAADIFAAASSNSNTDIQQLGEAMKYAGASANAAGMDLAQTATIMGILADSGVKGSMAGTTFTQMMADLKGGADNGRIAIGDMTVALYNQNGTMRDMGAVMADVGTATNGMTTAQRDAALGAIFGERSIRGVNIVLATGAERYRDLEGAIYNSDSAAQEMAETMEDNIGGAMRALRSQTEGILIQLGEQLAPIIREQIVPALKQFGDFLSRLIEWYSNLSPTAKSFVNILILMAVAAGPVLLVLSQIGIAMPAITKGIGLLSKGFGLLSKGAGLLGKGLTFLATNPVGLIILAITAIVAVIYLLWKNWDEVSAWFVDKWTWVKDSVGAGIEEVVGWFGSLPERVKGYLSDMVTRAKEAASDTFDTVIDTLSGLPGRLLTLGKDAISNFASGIRDAASSTLSGAVDNVMGYLNRFNPFARHSPSLVDRVQAGVAEISAQYQKLGQINMVPWRVTAGAGVGSGSSTVTHKGVIRVEGVDNQGQLTAVLDVVMDFVKDELRREVRRS